MQTYRYDGVMLAVMVSSYIFIYIHADFTGLIIDRIL